MGFNLGKVFGDVSKFVTGVVKSPVLDTVAGFVPGGSAVLGAVRGGAKAIGGAITVVSNSINQIAPAIGAVTKGLKSGNSFSVGAVKKDQGYLNKDIQNQTKGYAAEVEIPLPGGGTLSGSVTSPDQKKDNSGMLILAGVGLVVGYLLLKN